MNFFNTALNLVVVPVIVVKFFLYLTIEIVYIDYWVGREAHTIATYTRLRELYGDEKIDEYIEKVNRATPTILQLEECINHNKTS